MPSAGSVILGSPAIVHSQRFFETSCASLPSKTPAPKRERSRSHDQAPLGTGVTAAEQEHHTSHSRVPAWHPLAPSTTGQWRDASRRLYAAYGAGFGMVWRRGGAGGVCGRPALGTVVRLGACDSVE